MSPDPTRPTETTAAGTAPRPAHRPVQRSHHGDLFVDDFEWLRDRDNPEVIAHLEAENAWTEARTAHLESLRTQIYDEIYARTQQTDLSVPELVHHTSGDSWWYYQRTVEGQQYPLFCRAPCSDSSSQDVPASAPDGRLAEEQVLLDANASAEGHEFFSLGTFTVSPDGTRLAYSVDLAGDERFELRFADLTTGEPLPDVVQQVGHGGAWLGDEQFFYSRVDASWRPHQLWRHQLSSAADCDVLVMEEPDERFWLGAGDSRDGHWLVIQASSKITSECWLLGIDDPTGVPRSVAGRSEGVEYEVEPAGDRLLILHNRDNSDFTLAEADLRATHPDDWHTILNAEPGERFESVDAYDSHLVLSQRRNGLAAVRVMPRSSGGLGVGDILDFDEAIVEASAHSGPNWNTDTIRVTTTSLVTPRRVLQINLDDGAHTVLKHTPVLDHPTLGPYRPEDFVQNRLWAVADDGARIPISVVHHRDVDLDGTAGCVLYGYGSYEVSIPPAFSIPRLSLLDRGIVFAIAHVRGGGEMGRRWYEGGRTATKTNTFTDFIRCAETLIEQRYTSADRLAARGGSAGGLLMGAVANMRPELFRAIHAAVPFVDNLTTILDPNLPLTVIEWDEWGDPLHDAAAYRHLKSYSPYENVQPVNYPAILATTSLNDTRVMFVEPAKWIARLREVALNGPQRPLLLRCEMSAGHGGPSGRYAAWRDEAFELAWLIDQITPPSPSTA